MMDLSMGALLVRWMLAVFAGACSYGFVGTIAKSAYAAGFSSNELVGSQMLFAALALWALAAAFSKRRATPRESWLLLGAGTCIGMTSLFYYTSLKYLDASIAIVMLFQFTWIGLFIEAIIQRKFPKWEQWMAIGLLGIGTALAAGLASGGAPLSAIGVGWGLLSGLTYALVLIFSGRAAPAAPSFTRAALMVTGGVIFVLVVSPPTFLVSGALQRGLWTWASANALFSSVIPISLFSLGIPKIGPSAGTILGAAELPASVFVSWLLLNEIVSTMQWLGVAVILLAIALPELVRATKGRIPT